MGNAESRATRGHEAEVVMRRGAMGIKMLAATLMMLLGTAHTWAGDVPLRLLGRVESCGGDLIRFSSDGALMLTAGDGRARVWECKTLKPVGKEMMHGSDVIYARFEDGGRVVVTGTDGGEIKRWDERTGAELATGKVKPMLERAAVSGDGQYVAGVVPPVREKSGEVQVFEAASGKRVARILCDGHVEFVSLDADGSRVVVVIERGIHERGFLIWDVGRDRAACPEIRTAYDYHADVPLGLVPAAFSPDGKRLAVCDEKSFRLYDGSTGRLIAASPPRSGTALIHGVTFTSDGHQVVVHDSLGISGWSAPEAVTTMPDVGWGHIVRHDVSADGKRVALVVVKYRKDGTEEGRELSVWDWAEARLLGTAIVKDASAVALSPDGASVAVGRLKGGETFVWRIESP